MRRLVVLVVVLLALVISAPHAQTPALMANVDMPYQGAFVSAYDFYLAGWGFECTSGSLIDHLDVWYYVGDIPVYATGDIVIGVYRPDVYAAYYPACAVQGVEGWHWYFSSPPPLGATHLVITVWQGTLHRTFSRDITVR